jgi:hypothetical protein
MSEYKTAIDRKALKTEAIRDYKEEAGAVWFLLQNSAISAVC